MIYAIIGFSISGEERFHRLYKPLDIEYIKKEYDNKDISVRYLNDYTLVFHKYAGMVICFCVDTNENVLFISSLIVKMMQAFDCLVSNVCELNFVYALDKVYNLIDGFVCNGKIVEIEPIKIAENIEN